MGADKHDIDFACKTGNLSDIEKYRKHINLNPPQNPLNSSPTVPYSGKMMLIYVSVIPQSMVVIQDKQVRFVTVYLFLFFEILDPSRNPFNSSPRAPYSGKMMLILSFVAQSIVVIRANQVHFVTDFIYLFLKS